MRKFGTDLPLNSPTPVVSSKKSAGKQSRTNADASKADGSNANDGSAAVETDVVTSILKSANVAAVSTTAATPLASASDARRNLELEGSLQRAQQQDAQQSAAASKKKKKKKVRVKKTPRSTATKSSAGTRRTQKHHENEYTVQFDPGPLGMKLEPITTVTSPVSISGSSSSPATAATHTKMLGCRVVRFVNNSTPTRTTTSQARNFGVINPGDVVVGIDGVDVSTWEYSRVIELLKKKSDEDEESSEKKRKETGKAITFRAVGVRKSTVPAAGSAEDAVANADTATNRILAFDSSAAADKATVTSTTPTTEEEEDGHMATIDLNPLVEDVGTTSIGAQPPASGLFSPSNVKKLRKQREQLQNNLDERLRETPEFRSKDVLLCGNSSVLSAAVGGEKPGSESTMPTQQYQGKVPGLLSNVVSQTLLPAVSTVYSNLTTSASVADATVGKIGEALVGHSEQEFQEAVAAKMRLLHELSEVRATLGEDEETKRELTSKIGALERERDDAIKARAIFEEALQTAQREGDELRAAVEVTTGELTATKLESVEATASANKLAARNELLRAQTEQLRGHFGSKERQMSQELALAQSQLNESMEAIRILQDQITRHEEQLRIHSESAAASSQELVATSASARTYEEQLRAKQDALKVANTTIDEMRGQISALEQSLAETANMVDAERIEAEERRSDDVRKMQDTVSELQGELQAALSAKLDLTSALEGDVGKMQEEMGRVKSELEKHISELEGELQAALSAKTSREADIARITGEMEETNAKILAQKVKLEAQEADIRELTAKIADNVEEMQKKTDDAAQSWEDKEKELIAELNEQRDRADKAGVELKERMKEFGATMAEEASAKALLSEELRHLTDDFAESQDSLDDAKKIIESHELELAKVQKEMPTQIQELRRQADEAAKAWSSKEEELNREIKRQKGLVEETSAVSQAKEEYYENAMRKLQTRLDAKKEIINKANQKHAESTAKLEAQINALKNDIAQKETKLLKVESERNGDSTLLQTQLDAMMSSKNELEQEIQSLDARCRASQMAIDEANKKYEKLQSERNMIDIEKQSLSSKLAMEASAYSTAKAAHANELEKVKQDAEDQRRAFEEKVDALIAEVERVESFMGSEHSKLESHNKELGLSIAAKDDEIAILQSQLKSTEKSSSQEAERSNIELIQLRKELDVARHQLDETKTNVEGGERQIVEAQTIINDREQALCLALLRQSKNREEYENALSQRDAQITEMTKKVSAAESQIDTIKAERDHNNAAAESNVSHLVEVAEKADMRANEYKTLLEDREKSLKSVEDGLMNSCTQLGMPYAPSNDEAARNGSSSVLIDTITALTEKALEAMTQSSNRQNDVAKVEDQLFQVRSALGTTAESLSQCKASRDQWHTRALSAEQELDEFRVQVETLEADLVLSTEANDALSQNIDSMQSSLDALKMSRDRLDEALSNEIDEKRKLSIRVGFSEQKLSLKTEECERLERSVDELERKYEDVEATKNEEVQSKASEIQDSQATLEALQKDMKERTFALEVAETRLSKAQEIVATKTSEFEASSRTIEKQAGELARFAECSKILQEERDAMTHDLQRLRSLLDDDDSERVDTALLSDSALYLFERIGALKKQQELRDQQEETTTQVRRRQPPKPEVMVTTPACSKLNKSTATRVASTPSQLLSPLLTPSFTTGIISKHAIMLNELKILKATINQAAMASPDEAPTEYVGNIEDDGEISTSHHASTHARSLLAKTEKATEALFANLSSAKSVLSEKEGLLQDVADAVDEIEVEREELQHKVDTMQCYTQRMEETLTRELQWRKKAEAELKALRQKANARSVRREDEIKRTVAAEVATQLETTRQKLHLLKDYLREGGIVSAEDPQFSPMLSSTSAGGGGESFNWDISNDGEE